MKIAIMSYSFNKLDKAGVSDIFTYLETVRYRFGLDTADLWNGSLRSLDDDHLRKVRAALDERGLTLANLAVDGAHLWEDDPAVREQNHRNALANLRAAEILGAKSVRIDPGGPRDKTEWTNEQFDLIVKRFQEYLKRARDGGYRLGPENHWGPSMSPHTLCTLCQTINHPSFGVLLHFGRWNGPDAEQGDGLIAPWAMHTHIPGTVALSATLSAMDTVRAAGYQGVWSVEYVSMRYAELALRIAAVRDVLDQWEVDSGLRA